MELTLLRVLDMTPGADATAGKAELTTEPILLATLETESWRGDPTDEGEAIAELMLPEADGRLLLPTGSTLGRLMLEGVLR